MVCVTVVQMQVETCRTRLVACDGSGPCTTISCRKTQEMSSTHRTRPFHALDWKSRRARPARKSEAHPEQCAAPQ